MSNHARHQRSQSLPVKAVSGFGRFINDLKKNSHSAYFNAEAEREFLRLIKKGSLFGVKEIIKQIPLQVACLNHQLELVEYLLSYGGDPNYRYSELNNWTSLHLSVLRIVESKKSFLTIQLLLKKGADWTVKDLNGLNFMELLLVQLKKNASKKFAVLKEKDFISYFHQTELKSRLQEFFTEEFGRIHFDQQCSVCLTNAIVGRRYYMNESLLCNHCYLQVSQKKNSTEEVNFRIEPNDVIMRHNHSKNETESVSTLKGLKKTSSEYEQEIFSLHVLVGEQVKLLETQRSEICELKAKVKLLEKTKE